MGSSLDDREKNSPDLVVCGLMMFVLPAGSVVSDDHIVGIGLFVRSCWGTEVEHHHNIGTQSTLDIDTSFGSEKVFGAVVW